MLATAQGGSEPTPDQDATRREVLDVLAALGPQLLDASRALDTSDPTTARASLRRAAEILARYLT